ncbi:MAG: 4a-hydroxytetrahydrobiopterin dehydratase [Halanaeroarchaeum sp.]
MATRLSDDEIEARLPEGWTREADEIVRTFEFDDYLAGVAFAVDVGELAEEEFHHPTIRIDYESVTVSFTSHEAGGITDRDVELAELVNEMD